MEIANSRTFLVRRSRHSDAQQIVRLLREARYSHSQADWRIPVDELGQPGFVVGYSASSGANEELSSCLAVSTDQPPVSWVRLAAVRDSNQAQSLLEAMLERAVNYLRTIAVSQLGWLAAMDWPANWLAAAGFERINWICTYVCDEAGDYPEPDDGIIVRPAKTGDMPLLVSIEAAAFEPIWRHSEMTLLMALRESLSFDVAMIGGRVVGFQYGVRGSSQTSAHLVRITVDPTYQGHGVGSALMAVAMNGYRRRGIRRVTLNTQLDNYSSQRLYEKFGFTRTGDQAPVWSLTL